MQDDRHSEANRWLRHALALGAIGFTAAYMAGYTRGEMYGQRTREVTEYVTVDLPPDYAAACGAMMEAAWSMLDETHQPTDQDRADLLGR